MLRGPPSLLFSRYHSSFPGVHQPRRETEHSSHLELRLRTNGSITLLPLYGSWCAQWETLILTFTNVHFSQQYSKTQHNHFHTTLNVSTVLLHISFQQHLCVLLPDLRGARALTLICVCYHAQKLCLVLPKLQLLLHIKVMFGCLHHAVNVCSDDSEEHTASICRVTEFGSSG